MNYKFPILSHIDDVLPAIEGRDEFIVAKKDGYTVINYVVVKPDTFSRDEEGWEIRRECRGLIFDDQGYLISRPYHKFFNMNERDETDIKNLPFFREHNVLEKLDGSMVRPFMLNSELRLGTKMGITDTSMMAEEYLAGHHVNLHDQIEIWLAEGWTPIFEFVGPHNKIVVDYDQPGLYLTALREVDTGNYLDIQKFTHYTKKHNHKALSSDNGQLDARIDEIRSAKNSEGVVIRWYDGHMVKVKNDWYLRLHKTKDAISTDRKVVYYIINNELDDIMAILDATDKTRVRDIEDWFWMVYNDKRQHLDSLYKEVRTKFGDGRGEFARTLAKDISGFDKSAMFSMWDGHDSAYILDVFVKGHLSTETKWEKIYDYLES